MLLFIYFSFAAYLYGCTLQNGQFPYAISYTSKLCENPVSNLLAVLGIRDDRQKKVKFTVCGPPINHSYNNVTRIVEFIEVNILFGAGRFVFYNFSIGPEVEAILKEYVKEGLVEMVQWPLPNSSNTVNTKNTNDDKNILNMHYYAQLAAINDCLYRNIYRSAYIIYADMDEVLVPRKGTTWDDVLRFIARDYKNSNICTYLVRNVFFRTDWQLDLNMTRRHNATNLNLITLLNTKREKHIFRYGARSKYIASTNRVRISGIHQAWVCLRESDQYHVPKEIALLHHYRIWDDSPDNMSNSVLDQSMHNIAADIVSRVSGRLNKYQHHA